MKKMMPWLITILLAITLIAIVSIILFKSILNEETGEKTADSKPVEVKVLSADDRLKVTSELKEFKRNLKDTEFLVVLSFAFQLDNKKTKEDFDKLIDIEVKPIINRTIADMTAEELHGSVGEDALESKLLNLINPIMPKGKLVKVEITEIIITEL